MAKPKRTKESVLRLVEIGKGDAYYNTRDKYIGKLFQSVRSHDSKVHGFKAGEFALLDKRMREKDIYFYAAKFKKEAIR